MAALAMRGRVLQPSQPLVEDYDTIGQLQLTVRELPKITDPYDLQSTDLPRLASALVGVEVCAVCFLAHFAGLSCFFFFLSFVVIFPSKAYSPDTPGVHCIAFATINTSGLTLRPYVNTKVSKIMN